MGECLYTTRDFDKAVSAFKRVIEVYPTGNKVPDALLKMGLSLLSLGERGLAKNLLTEVVKVFPASNASRVARERLRGL